MVIYYRLTLVVLTHCFARPTGGSLQTLYDLWSRHVSFTIEELGAETDIKLFNAIVGGTLLTFCTIIRQLYSS